MCATSGPKWFLPPNSLGDGSGAFSAPVVNPSNPQPTVNAGTAAAPSGPPAPSAPTAVSGPSNPVSPFRFLSMFNQI